MTRSEPDRVTSAHGAGGRATARLIQEVFLPRLGSSHLGAGEDGVWLGDLAVTTDAFVVTPWTFPGGMLGSLAVHGVVNDLAVIGARARHLTVTFVIEEGVTIESLAEQVAAMGAAAQRCGVEVVAADTKVVERGHGDGCFVSVTALGGPIGPWRPNATALSPGDAVVVSGPIADHGVAVMVARGDLALSVDVVSDSAPVVEAVAALVSTVPGVRVLRDPTRGGLATVVNELVMRSGLGAIIREADVPVRPAVRATCELLGLDPLYVACEGRFVALVEADHAEEAVAVIDAVTGGGATVVGEVTGGDVVELETHMGGRRRLDVLVGDPLPRIC